MKNIQAVKNEDDIPAPRTVEVHVSLLKAPKVEPKIEMVNGKEIKNFKTFQKVLPLSMQLNNTSFASGSSRGKGKGNSTKSNRSMKVTFVDYEHAPSVPGSCNQWARDHRVEVEVDVAQERQRNRRIIQDDDSDMEIGDIMPDTEAPPELAESQMSSSKCYTT